MSDARSRRSGVRALVGSKWTATPPRDRDKHFVVVGLRYVQNPEEGPLQEDVELELRAVISGRSRHVSRKGLLDGAAWKRGWH